MIIFLYAQSANLGCCFVVLLIRPRSSAQSRAVRSVPKQPGITCRLIPTKSRHNYTHFRSALAAQIHCSFNHLAWPRKQLSRPSTCCHEHTRSHVHTICPKNFRNREDIAAKLVAAGLGLASSAQPFSSIYYMDSRVVSAKARSNSYLLAYSPWTGSINSTIISNAQC